MKLSAKSRYALEAMVYLAACAPQQNVCIRQVSQATGITESYLEQIFFRLRKAGLLTAVRGAGGGFYPGRPPEEISAGDIVRAMEDESSPVGCVHDPSSCKNQRAECCQTRGLWVELTEEIYRQLDSQTLASLKERFLAAQEQETEAKQ